MQLVNNSFFLRSVRVIYRPSRSHPLDECSSEPARKQERRLSQTECRYSRLGGKLLVKKIPNVICLILMQKFIDNCSDKQEYVDFFTDAAMAMSTVLW